MNKALLKKWYLLFSLVLSIFLLVVTILGFTPLKHEAFMEPLNTISLYVLCFFVVELVVLLFMADSFTSYLREQWISIIAVLSSLSITVLLDGAVAIGSLTGLKVLKGIKGVKAVKALKSMKGLKVLKATKSAKVAKTVKLAKKTKKAHYEASVYQSEGK